MTRKQTLGSAVVAVVAPGGTATRCFVAETAEGGGCDESLRVNAAWVPNCSSAAVAVVSPGGTATLEIIYGSSN